MTLIFSNPFSRNISNINEIDELIIQVNHLLYVLENSDLEDNVKNYYKYYIVNCFNSYKQYSHWCRDSLRNLVNGLTKVIDNESVIKLTNSFNELSLEEKSKDIDNVPYSVEIFLMKIGDLNSLTPVELLNYFYGLDNKKKKIVLENKDILKKLQGLLALCVDKDEYKEYDYIYKRLGFESFVKIFDASYLKEFYKKTKNLYEYRIFHTILEHDVNKAVEYFLINDDYFLEFLKDIDKYNFTKLNYELVVKILMKIQNMEDRKYWKKLPSINYDFQENLLKENFSYDFLIVLIPHLNNKTIQYFISNDFRFRILWNRFNILDLCYKGFKFPEDIINKPEFLDKFKACSMINFRNNVNTFLNNQGDLGFEEKVMAYEDELISHFDLESGLFLEYIDLINNIMILDNNEFINKGLNFFYDTNFSCRKYVYRDDNDNLFIRDKEGLIEYLKWLSIRKLNEIIIDRLFKDDIYNVFLNIKEMLRYNELLKEERVLDEEKVKFYSTILDIDKLSYEDIFKIYNEYKDKNVALMFYEDLRSLKDVSYDKIKDSLFNADKNTSRDEALSNEYGIDVYDLRDKNYYMLVSSMGRMYQEETFNRRLCYTLLSDENTSVFHDNNFIYGFSNFDNDCVLHVLETDSYSADSDKGTDRVNRIMTPRQIVTNHTWYSEVLIVNKKENYKNSKYETLKPSFLVVFDRIDENTLKEAKRLNIPICIITKSKELSDELVGSVPFNDREDIYTKERGMSSEEEDKKRSKR